MNTERFESLHVTLSPGGKVALLRFDHGKANEMGSQQLKELEWLVDELQHSDSIVGLVSWSERRSSKGTPIFVAGANVTERVGWEDDRVKQHVRWQREVLASLKAAPVFHVCVVGGVAFGWGTEFLLTADYRIAHPGARFALPETGLGILPGAGGTSDLWAHVGVAHTLRLGMTGEAIGPDEAMRLGLVQENATDFEQGMTRARELTELASRRSPTAIAAFKRSVLAAVGRAPQEREALEAIAYEHCVDSGQAAIGRAHFAEIRAGEVPPWGVRVPLGGGDASS